jgi:excisionase family DNA binding protein
MNAIKNYIDDVMSDSPLLLSCTQAADLLNVSRASVYRLMDTGELDRVRISLSTDGRPTTRITNESVRNLLISWSTKS